MSHIGVRIAADTELRAQFEVALQDAMTELSEALGSPTIDRAFRNNAEYAIYTGLRGTAAALHHGGHLTRHPLLFMRVGMAASQLELLIGCITTMMEEPSLVGSEETRTTIGEEAVDAADRYVAMLAKANVLGRNDAGSTSDLRPESSVEDRPLG